MAKSKQEKIPGKHTILLKGAALHLFTYIILCGILVMLGVPIYMAFIVFMVLAWGLFVLSYALWNQKS